MSQLEITRPKFSLVTPIFNEEENIEELYKRIVAVMQQIYTRETEPDTAHPAGPSHPSDKPGSSDSRGFEEFYEIIFIDDGSTDSSWDLIKSLHSMDDRVKGINFSRNFGHHIAITAGVDSASGDFVVLMDGDLQDPPEEIPKLYDKIREGYDVVYAIRKTRNDPILKVFSSKLFHFLFKRLGNIDLDPNSGIFRILNRKSADALRKCTERSRFIIGLIGWAGFRTAGVETERSPRFAGKTKYNLYKSFLLAINGITSFSYFPLRIASFFGWTVAFISGLFACLMIIKKIVLGIPIEGYASLIVSILFIGSIQLIIMGIMGEYIGRIFTEVQRRPIYLINEKLGI